MKRNEHNVAEKQTIHRSQCSYLTGGVILTTETYLAAKSRLETNLSQQVDDLGNTFAASVNYWFNSKGSAIKAFQADPSYDIEIVKGYNKRVFPVNLIMFFMPDLMVAS